MFVWFVRVFSFGSSCACDFNEYKVRRQNLGVNLLFTVASFPETFLLAIQCVLVMFCFIVLIRVWKNRKERRVGWSAHRWCILKPYPENNSFFVSPMNQIVSYPFTLSCNIIQYIICESNEKNKKKVKKKLADKNHPWNRFLFRWLFDYKDG